ncbi:MAG: phosphopentomutase [Bacilli bacterium]|nr:phosphopentomutase [Clostridium sp.]MDY6015566.1 phosphopentomutase [Bacilli bacterium]
MKFKRVFLMVLDSLGVGEASDAKEYGDVGANTLKNVNDACNLFIPNLEKLGIMDTINMNDNENVEAYYTIARPKNSGKDSLVGHYEMVGIENYIPFHTFTEKGFPIELIDKIEMLTKTRVIGNKVSTDDGLDVINELGDRNVEYGSLILFTTYNSTLQIAAHEDVIPVSKLYDYCKLIRRLTIKEDYKIARIIARPFTGKKGKYRFTNEKCEYSVNPPARSVLNSLKDKGFSVISIGKINDIFNGEGITKVVKSNHNNSEAINKLTDIMEKNFTGLCMINLSDFDQLYGHNKDVEGYAKCIEDLDVEMPLILNKLADEDLLIITADHGNDPTFSNGHTRENVPVIVYNRCFQSPSKLDILDTMADIGATIADNFEVMNPGIGKSFLEKLK